MPGISDTVPTMKGVEIIGTEKFDYAKHCHDLLSNPSRTDGYVKTNRKTKKEYLARSLRKQCYRLDNIKKLITRR